MSSTPLPGSGPGFAPGSAPVAVTLLTQADCVLCERAKEVLRRTSEEHLTDVTVVDLTTDAGLALALKHSVLFAPGVLVDGKVFSHGRLSEKKLRRHLIGLTTHPTSTP